MRSSLRLATLLLLPFLIHAQAPNFQLNQFALTSAGTVDIAHCGDSRLFLVKQSGIINVVDSTGKVLVLPFIDIRTKVQSGGEQGLLGLAFHPNYAQNGWFFVNYTAKPNGATRISRFSVSTTDPNKADPDSELPLLEVAQPFPNHNGGCIKFGPDGKLYIGMGDGGSGGDPYGYGQKTDILLAKMLRLDVDSCSIAQPYKIPADNPYAGQAGYKPEIWAMGLRNPWRFSFDRLTGEQWIGDVGQDREEEINAVPPGVGGLNFGWRCFEGTRSYNTSGCPILGDFVSPVFTYDHSVNGGCSVTGGFVYRGAKYPDLYGKYIFTDYCTGRWWTVVRDSNGRYTGTAIANLSDFEYTTLGEDAKGELYVSAASSGRIYQLSYVLPVATRAPGDVLGCNISPNPTQDVFELNLTMRQSGAVRATLRNAAGQQLATQEQEATTLRMQFDLSDWPASIYYLHIQTPAGSMIRPVVKW